MAQAQFPEPKSLDIFQIGDGMPDKNFGKYSLTNPHPGYGKDPNILNEYGHTAYPKWIYPNGRNEPGIVVNNKAEEDKHYKPEEAEPPIELKEDGPTVGEFIAAGYKASDYPPHGYASKSSKEEIDEAVAKEKELAEKHPWG